MNHADPRHALVVTAILSHAIGDALGVPFEFTPRVEEREQQPLRMQGWGVHDQPPGTFSDDTSMLLCLVEALVHHHGPLPSQPSSEEHLARLTAARFLAWWNQGLWTADPQIGAFDIGGTTRKALQRIGFGEEPQLAGPDSEYENGNGALMRIAPLVFATWHLQLPDRLAWVRTIASITHGHSRSTLACILYLEFLRSLLQGKSFQEAYTELPSMNLLSFLNTSEADELPHFKRILSGEMTQVSQAEIHSDGYVVHSLEAALYCLLDTDSFESAVTRAVRLGSDSDTTAAITAFPAGIVYGAEAIPDDWLQQLKRREEIKTLATAFVQSPACTLNMDNRKMN